MQAVTKGLLLILVGMFFQGCEEYKCADGIVRDKLTNLPLDSVLTEVTTGAKTLYTDSTGKFEVYNKMGGCVPNCKDLIIRFSKTDYQTITLTNPGTDEIVWMEK